MIVLNSEIMDKSVTRLELLAAVEKALTLQETGSFIQPDRIHMNSGDGTLLLMPSAGWKQLGVKVISLFEGNTQKNLPVLRGLMLLYDGKDGEPLAILDGAKLTALRTGAVGATGVKYLSPPSVSTLGVVGASVQGIQQALFSLSVRSFLTLNLMDFNEEKMAVAARVIQAEYPHLIINQCGNITELLERSEVVITATNSRKPVLPDQREMIKGKCYVGIGSYKPYMREFPDVLFSEINEIYVDTLFGLEESGDLIDPVKKGLVKEENVILLGKLISGELKIDINRDQTVFFKSVGMALFDLITAKVIYENAREKGLGQKVSI